MFLPFYIIEVEIKPQREGIIYRAEDNCRYQRCHGSTTNLENYETNNMKDFFRQAKEESVRCHRCGDMGHRSKDCKQEVKETSLIKRSHRKKYVSARHYVFQMWRGRTQGHGVRFCQQGSRWLLYLAWLVNFLFLFQRRRETSQPYCVECETHGHWIRMCPKLWE